MFSTSAAPRMPTIVQQGSQCGSMLQHHLQNCMSVLEHSSEKSYLVIQFWNAFSNSCGILSMSQWTTRTSLFSKLIASRMNSILTGIILIKKPSSRLHERASIHSVAPAYMFLMWVCLLTNWQIYGHQEKEDKNLKVYVIWPRIMIDRLFQLLFQQWKRPFPISKVYVQNTWGPEVGTPFQKTPIWSLQWIKS